MSGEGAVFSPFGTNVQLQKALAGCLCRAAKDREHMFHLADNDHPDGYANFTGQGFGIGTAVAVAWQSAHPTRLDKTKSNVWTFSLRFPSGAVK